MSVSHVAAFAACAEEKNFTKAAEKLGYTQSAVSQIIRSFEKELGLRLLERDNRSVTLTAEGEALYPYTRQLLAAEEDLKKKAQDLAELRAGRVRIGTISSIALRRLPDVIRRFREAYPEVQVTVTGSSYEVIEELLLEGKIDIGFVSGISRPEFETVSFVRDRLMLVLPAECSASEIFSRSFTGTQSSILSAPEAEILPESLGAYRFILPAEGAHYDIGALFERYGLAPEIPYHMDDDYTALELVRQGFGVTILPELLLEACPTDGIRTVPIRNTGRLISAAVNRKRLLSIAAETFLKTLFARA